MHTKMKSILGFSLIEILVAIFVLSFGILAIAKFQGTLLQSGSSTKSRTAALALANEKIDDLRGFSQIEVGADCGGGTDDCDWTIFTATELTTKQQAYDYIDDNEGGRLAPAVGYTLESNGTNYARTWEVKSEADEPNKLEDQKWAKVTIQWIDENNEIQNVSMETIIPRISPSIAEFATIGAGSDPTPPSFGYTPGDAPDVIKTPISTGDNKFKETSKALPDVSQQGNHNLVTFTVVSFTEDGGNATIDNVEAFATVNCNCSFSSSAQAFTPAHIVWDDDDNKIIDERGEAVSKITGAGVGTEQPGECDACCRDHHDADIAPIKYVQGTSSGNHTHYNATGTVVTSGNYVEACRFKSIDGILSLFQDWQLQTITVMDDSYLADNTTTQAAYIAYVSNYVGQYTAAIPSGSSPSLPSVPTGRDIPQLPQGASQQLLARTIYIDEVIQDGSDYSDCIGDIGTTGKDCENVDIRAITPFVELNSTKLANWKIAANTTTSVGTDTQADDATNASTCPPTNTSSMTLCVTNEDIVDEGVDDFNYSRALTVAGDVAATQRVISGVNADNTGITGTDSLQPDGGNIDGSTQDDTDITQADARIEENPHSDFIAITVAAGLTTYGVSGQFEFCTGTKNNEKGDIYDALSLNVTGATGSCSKSKQGQTYSYSCDGMVSGSNPRVNASGSNVTPSSHNFTNILSGKTGFNFTLCGAV
jgi:type II secretory pathway pseudopilin PulG